MVTDEMVEKAADAMARQDITFANCDRGWQRRTIRAALEAALSTDAEPVKTAPAVAVKADLFDVEDAREKKLETVVAPDNGTTEEVFSAVLQCAEAWVPEARIIGNVRAGDIARAVRSALSAQVQDVEVKSFIVYYVYSDNEMKTRTFAYETEQPQAEAFCQEVKAKGGSVNIRIAAAPAAKQGEAE